MQNTYEKIKSSRRIRLFLIVLSIILIVLMFPKGESIESEVRVNSIWIEDDLIASLPFEILKDQLEYEREKTAAAEKVNDIFVKQDGVASNVADSIRSYNNFFLGVLDADIYIEEENGLTQTFLTESSYNTFKQIRRQENVSSRPLYTMNDVFRVVQDIVTRVYRRGYINKPFSEIEHDSISVREGKFQRVFPKSNYYDPVSVNSLIENRLDRFFGNSDELLAATNEYIKNFVLPNYIFSQPLTKEAKSVAINKISGNKGIVNENERIVAKHDRITKEIKAKIDSYRIAKGAESDFWARFGQNVGKLTHVILIFTLFIIYIYLFRKKIYHDNYKILLISIIILLIAFTAFLVGQLNVNGPVELLILVPVASMLLTIMFDSRVGFYGTIVCALIVGALRGNDYAITVMNIVAGGFAAYTVRDIKNRTQIFRSFLFILIGYVGSILAFGLERFDTVENLLVDSAFAASNAIISPALTFGLIIFFEKIFRITTELTLLELSDFNTPLLRDLARNAPGTFNHSMTIGSMVENAAEVIGANPILARVGAYYHDIGKLNNPDGFVENQMSEESLHQELDEKQSAELIINHVEQGIELAKQHKLPQEIIDFIPMHHGTLAVMYFYEKSKEKFGAENVNKDDFRYPGPKPNSKETALLMMADACESAVRSMVDPTPEKIENMVNNLVKIRIEDGQLNEAPITFGDVSKIKEEFIKILISHHHKRIRYPKQEEMEKKI
jgi:putative nucleotidyltransferase with HDIG domain